MMKKMKANNKNIILIYKMSLQAIIDQHANNMVARHAQIEEMINDQAATRATEIGEKAKAINDAYEQAGSALGSAAGAYHLGRSVYRAYQKKGLKGAAKAIQDKVKESKGDLKNIKADDDKDDDGEGGEGDAPTGDAPTGDAPTGPIGTATDDPDEVSDRLDRLVSQAREQAAQPTDPNTDANQDPRDPAGEQPEAEASEPREINLGDPESDPAMGNLDFQNGGVAEPEDLQVKRWGDMAQRVFNRNRAQGLDIEGRPLPEGVNPDELKPAERVLADVSQRAKAAPQEPPKPQGGDEETNPDAVSQQPAAEPQPEGDFLDQAQKPQGKLFDDAPAPSDDASAADKPLNADSNSSPNIETSATDDAVDDAAQQGSKIASKVANSGKTALQETGNVTDETLSKVGSGLSDTLPETLEAAGSALDFIPVVGEITGLGLGLYGLIESIIGKKPDASDEKKIIPTAPSASGIDPQAIARTQTLS